MDRVWMAGLSVSMTLGMDVLEVAVVPEEDMVVPEEDMVVEEVVEDMAVIGAMAVVETEVMAVVETEVMAVTAAMAEEEETGATAAVADTGVVVEAVVAGD